MAKKNFGVVGKQKYGLDSAFMESLYVRFASKFREEWKSNVPVDTGRLKEFFHYKVRQSKTNATIEFYTMPYLESNPSLEGAEKLIEEKFFETAELIIGKLLKSPEQNIVDDIFGVRQKMASKALDIYDELQNKFPGVDISIDEV
jgi:hypothetical protein